MYVELYKEYIKPFFLNYTKHFCKRLTKTTDHVNLNGRQYSVVFFQAAFIPLQDMSHHIKHVLFNLCLSFLG